MICAYDKTYLEKAKISMGRMMDFAVYDLNYDIDDFFQLFIESGVAKRFENGDSATLAGKSGVELAYEVLERTQGDDKRMKPSYTANRSEEYWTGYVLAYYQWLKAKPFRDIVEHIPIKRVKALYNPYHEMDIRQFVDKMDELYKRENPDTNLKKKRMEAGLSQKDLADICGISVRTIQEYEQGRKNINKAQVECLVILSQALCCNIKELLESE